MTLGELIRLFRQQADDGTSHSLWADPELAAWANDAEVEACRRARLIVDSHTPEVCQVNVIAGTAEYPTDHRIIYIRRVKAASRTLPLCAQDYRDLDNCAPGWETHQGNVTAYVRGMDSNLLRLYKIPKANDLVNLLVVREPLEPMENPDDTPEINARYHTNLVEWMLYRGYSRTEAQTYDPKLAAQHLQLFEGEFGTRNKASAFEEEWQRNNLPFTIQDGNF